MASLAEQGSTIKSTLAWCPQRFMPTGTSTTGLHEVRSQHAV